MEPSKAISLVKEHMLNETSLDEDDLESQGRCIYTFVKDDGTLFTYQNACFSSVYEIRNRDLYPYIGFYVKKPIIASERHERWVQFVMDYYTELAESELFETTLDDLPYVVVNTDHQYNVIMSALTSMRMVYEQHFYVELWNILVEAGVDKVTAWIFTHLCNATPVDGGHFWLYMKPDREYEFYVPQKNSIFHTSLHAGNFSHKSLARMYKREYVKGVTSHWDNSSGGVNGVHDMFGLGSDEAIDFVKSLSAGSKGKSNNPFTRNQATTSKLLNLEGTTKFFLSIVDKFEEEFKP